MSQVRQNKSSRRKKTKNQKQMQKGASFMGFPMPSNVSGSIKANDTPFGNYSANGSVSFKTEAPMAYGQVDSISGPQMMYGANGDVRIIHREYLTDILYTGGFTANGFTVLNTFLANPSNQSNFPWLSGVAQNFEKFCFNKLCYRYVTQSPTTSPGSVMIIPDYDVDTGAPATKQQALTFKDAVRTPGWQDCCAFLPESRLCNYKDYFVQIGADQRLSVPASIYICASGGSDSSPLEGEIWVEYDIRLLCPTQNTNGTDTLEVGSPSSANPFNFYTVNPFWSPNTYLETGTVYPTSGKILTLAPGDYLLSAAVGGVNPVITLGFGSNILDTVQVNVLTVGSNAIIYSLKSIYNGSSTNNSLIVNLTGVVTIMYWNLTKL